MTLVINLTADEEQQLSAICQAQGLAPDALIRSLIAQASLPSASSRNELLRYLQTLQEAEGLDLPQVPARELFAQWAKEDAEMPAAEMARGLVLSDQLLAALTRDDPA